jgi:hypothetical protein
LHANFDGLVSDDALVCAKFRLTPPAPSKALEEERCSDVLRRFARAYGPRPLAFNREASRRYRELDQYIRQSHAERDLESLERKIHDGYPMPDSSRNLLGCRVVPPAV